MASEFGSDMKGVSYNILLCSINFNPHSSALPFFSSYRLDIAFTHMAPSAAAATAATTV